MYLKELDLQGFKSFPEKVRLEFNKGITAVVGPNGSGKSNISDAVRWVLGEQRAKSLRGGKMEDVIFAGTANRKPVGFAEVSMTVDNSDRKIPVDYTEITIARRVYRSGESSYLINGTECRLKDIYELFMDTGIGRDGYSIIGQGKIDEILSNKSEDRRRLFEEAAGIVKFKNRRFEAEAKLDREQQNLVRVTDIISEIEMKIGPLEKQAEKAKKYLEFYGEMKEADIQLFRINGEHLENEISRMSGLTLSAEGDIFQNEEKLEKIKSEAEEIRNIGEKLTSDIEVLNRILTELAGEIEKNEGLCRLTNEQIKNLKESVERLEGEKKTKQEKIFESSQEAAKANEETLKSEEEISILKASLKDKEEFLNAMLDKQSEHEKRIEDIKSEMIEKIKATADIKSSLERTQTMLEQFDARIKQIAYDKNDNENKLRDKKIAAKSAELRAEQNKEDAEEIKRALERLEAKKAGIINIINIIKNGLEEKTRLLGEKQSRLRVLTDMEKEHDGYYKSVKAVLQLKDNGEIAFKGVHGAVAQLFKTEEKYELAIETALGGNLQSIVVEKELDAKTAVNYLKTKQLGRATFLPVATVKGRTFGVEKDNILNEKGVIAAAVDLVKFDAVYRGIAESLLGRTVVIDSIDNAIVFASKYKQSHRIVTLEGDVFMPGGSITGGSTGRKSSGVFGRKREMDNLKIETESLLAACNGLKAELDRNNDKIDKIEEEAEDKKDEASNINIAYITTNNELQQLEEVIAEYKEKVRLNEIEQKQIAEQKAMAESDVTDAKRRLEETEKSISETEKMLDDFRINAESNKTDKDTLLEHITRIKVEVSALESKKDAQVDTLKRLEGEKILLESEISAIEAEKNELIRRISEKQNLANDVEHITASKRKEKAGKENELLSASENRKKESEKLIIIERDINDYRDTILKHKNELVRLESKSEKLADDKKRLFDSMWDNYEITYPEALKYPPCEVSIGELKINAGLLKNKIKELGSVNVNAVDEYAETKERYEFLSKQKSDIISAEEKLKGIIKDLSSLMEKQFKEKLEVISENFNEVFREMFGGGRAYLKLAEEDDVLESGIDIIAQPPGKNLQSMMLLSGGERSLTAIAILFSILKMKPSPFCILDEIEAALDDANVLRFGDYLQRFADDTQFIVITHRKGTMESADVLYGVTMQEAGVSKIVSVKFDEAVRENAI
ncbi:MAG: chromosome segregation protein SMC [Candidatus Metalachnospira sp.]|nr:chromosome segregation protein SMC [Candidatus Metalachnospira sp.]